MPVNLQSKIGYIGGVFTIRQDRQIVLGYQGPVFTMATRATTISNSTDEKPEVIRAGMHLAGQNVRNRAQVRQLILSAFPDTAEERLEEVIDGFGLELSVAEDRCVHAILVLLDKNSYQDRYGTGLPVPAAWKFSGNVPRIETTWSEFFEAYGCPNAGADGQRARRALMQGLQRERRFILEMKRWTGEGKRRKQVSDVIVIEGPLLKITQIAAYEGLDSDQVANILQTGQGPSKRRRASKLIIEPSPLFIAGIEDFFFLKPKNMYRELDGFFKGKKIGDHVPRFFWWLFRLHTSPFRIGARTLAERIGLEKHLERREQRLMRRKIDQCFQCALELGYITEFSYEDFSDQYRFTLNSQRCSRAIRRPDSVHGERTLN